MRKAVCFLISPIGDSGSETRQRADDVRDGIVRPVMDVFGIELVRGDHHSDAGQIDVDVIRSVQEAELCIADLSQPNPNVYYELGRRDETGKPIILIKEKNSPALPVDIGTRRYVEYDLSSARGMIDAVAQLKSFVEPFMKEGFQHGGGSTSLAELGEMLRRLERKVDKLSQNRSAAVVPTVQPQVPERIISDPMTALKLAIHQRNIPVAEQAMDVLRLRMDTLKFLDQVVTQVANIGSVKAGDILIENAQSFIDSDFSLADKLAYVACLINNISRTDREREQLELAEQLCGTMCILTKDGTDEQRIEPYNQLNFIYYGVYLNSRDEEDIPYLYKARECLDKALEIAEFPYLHNNYASVEYNFPESEGPEHLESAREHILRCLEMDEQPNASHLELAYKIFTALHDSGASDYLEQLELINPDKAQLLRLKYQNG